MHNELYGTFSPGSVAELEDQLSTPSEADREFAARLKGDLVILGAGGKLGPSLARLAKRAFEEVGRTNQVVAVSRFASEAARREFETYGIRAISCDLLQPEQVAHLPDGKNVLYLAGRKFGSTGRPDVTWAMNTIPPALCASHYCRSRIIVFSTGNVYGLSDVDSKGARETDEPAPVGEYAQSCLARERIVEYYASEYNTRCLIFRLNYAVDLRYGVLVDIARKVFAGEAVDLTVPVFNAIWQRDANSYAFRALELCQSPARILNAAGSEGIRVRNVALWFAKRFDRHCHFQNDEGTSALLSDASLCHSLLGLPGMPLSTLLERVAGWISRGGELLDKPTHFEVVDGRY